MDRKAGREGVNGRWRPSHGIPNSVPRSPLSRATSSGRLVKFPRSRGAVVPHGIWTAGAPLIAASITPAPPLPQSWTSVVALAPARLVVSSSIGYTPRTRWHARLPGSLASPARPPAQADGALGLTRCREGEAFPVCGSDDARFGSNGDARRQHVTVAGSARGSDSVVRIVAVAAAVATAVTVVATVAVVAVVAVGVGVKMGVAVGVGVVAGRGGGRSGGGGGEAFVPVSPPSSQSSLSSPRCPASYPGPSLIPHVALPSCGFLGLSPPVCPPSPGTMKSQIPATAAVAPLPAQEMGRGGRKG